MKKPQCSLPSLVVCVDNTGHPASLEKRKIYQAVADKNLREKRLLRVLDESGESHLYPEKYFLPIHLPKKEQTTISRMR